MVRISSVSSLTILFVCSACQDPGNGPPEITGIEPSVVSSLRPMETTVIGNNLFVEVQVDLDNDQAPQVDNRWQVHVGGTRLPASAVTWRSSQAIDITIPADWPMGTHEVAVTNGEQTLTAPAAALTVTEEPVGFAITIEDAPDGSGASIGDLALPVGQTLTLYALARDGDSLVSATPDVTWEVSGAIGTVLETSGNATTFQATAPGTGVVRAHHSYNDSGETGVISTICDDGAGWTHQRLLTFDNGAQSEDLDNFPVLVVLDESRIDYSRIGPQGQDLRFFDADQVTRLPHEIERWDPMGPSYVWVEVPRIDARSQSDHIVMRYGNPLAMSDENPAAVWSAGFEAVWHLGAGSTGDSGPGGHHGDNHGAEDTPGVIGVGKSFDPAGMQYIDTTYAAPLSSFTIEVWVKGDQVPIYAQAKNVFARENSFQINWDHLEDDFRGGVALRTGGNYHPINYGGLDADTWYYLSATYDGDVLRAYRDGVLVGDDTGPMGAADTNSPPDLTATIGRHALYDNLFFDGAIDEVRVSRTARSANWIRAQHASMVDAFVTIGPEQCATVL